MCVFVCAASVLLGGPRMDDARLRASKLQSAECHHKANAKHGTEHYTRKVNICICISHKENVKNGSKLKVNICLCISLQSEVTTHTLQTQTSCSHQLRVFVCLFDECHHTVVHTAHHSACKLQRNIVSIFRSSPWALTDGLDL